ncbi:polysaccharide biosynthesis protein [Bacillus sp. 1NLA3E]|nr:polysaccharide biosynthesis protein [Bacillus sp. 1NLA3E]
MKNISTGILASIIIAILGFISRKIFLDSLGAEYLGINGLLTNILAMLALVESGIGTSIVYNLYKPLAENDRPRIIALIQLYKKAYSILALIILILSLILFPFLDFFIRESETIPYLSVAYFIFVSKNLFTYLNAHRVSLINADQKGYILTNINTIFQIVMTIAKIVVLILTKNYLLFLLIDLTIFGIQTIIYGRLVGKRYSYIKTTEKHYLNNREKQNLVKNIKALFLHNIGSFCVNGTDYILISMYVGIVTVGQYSNYTMILGQVTALIASILGGIGASVGNLIAVESKEKSFSIFNITYLVNFWIYSISVIFLYNLLNPFIRWWLGEEYLLDSLTFIIILINFYLIGLRGSISTFKNKAGIFVQDKYVPLIEAVINLAASIILVNFIGLPGIFIGTLLSTLCIVFWNVPRLVYKYVFNVSVWLYFKKYVYYLVLTIVVGFVTTFICKSLIPNGNLLSLVGKGIICIVVPNIIYVVLFYKSQEFIYIKTMLSRVIPRLKIKINSAS